MNGDVTSRDEALGLISEFGVDGAMIATAAETNPSVFRPDSEGGKAPWEEVVKGYVKTAMEVDNRWGNTKFLLGQMIPGKQPAYQAMTKTKSYSELVKALGYQEEFGDIAKEVDRRLEIGEFEKPKMTKAERKAANKAAAAHSAQTESNGSNSSHMQSKSRTGVKRTADVAQLDMPPDVARDIGPATVPEQASTLVV